MLTFKIQGEKVVKSSGGHEMAAMTFMIINSDNAIIKITTIAAILAANFDFTNCRV